MLALAEQLLLCFSNFFKIWGAHRYLGCGNSMFPQSVSQVDNYNYLEMTGAALLPWRINIDACVTTQNLCNHIFDRLCIVSCHLHVWPANHWSLFLKWPNGEYNLFTGSVGSRRGHCDLNHELHVCPRRFISQMMSEYDIPSNLVPTVVLDTARASDSVWMKGVSRRTVRGM